MRCGSFVATATEFGMSPSCVSKRIGVLEEALNAQLLHRTTRKVVLTGDGENVHEWARTILDDVEGMVSTLARTRADPCGHLRISASFRLGRAHIAPVVSLLVARFPKLEVSLTVLDHPVDLAGEGYDLDVRIGEVAEPNLIAHHIATSRRMLCAAPTYIERHGVPCTPADLASHSCLVFRDRGEPYGTWRLLGPEGMHTLKVAGSLSSNNNDIIWRWALDGHGIIRAADWDCAESLSTGELVRVLPDYSWPADVYAVTTQRLSRSARVRACVALLKEQLRDGPFALFPASRQVLDQIINPRGVAGIGRCPSACEAQATDIHEAPPCRQPRNGPAVS